MTRHGAGQLVALVMRQAGALAVTRPTLGLALSLASSRVLASLLFGVTPRDATLTAAVGTLGLAALLAAWIPARRAATIDPIQALRVE